MFKARTSQYLWQATTCSRLDIKTLMPIKEGSKGRRIMSHVVVLVP